MKVLLPSALNGIILANGNNNSPWTAVVEKGSIAVFRDDNFNLRSTQTTYTRAGPMFSSTPDNPIKKL